MDSEQLIRKMSKTTLAFRGYNITNLGRTPELLAHPVYGTLVRRRLKLASDVAADLLGRPVDLVGRVEAKEETDLSSYGEAIALIMAVSIAQLEILDRCFGVAWGQARSLMGYSLGEVVALVAGGAIAFEDALKVPVSLADDSAALASDARLGILFSRGPQLVRGQVERLCQELNLAGDGVVGISAVLSPNSMLLLGQGTTLKRFQRLMRERFPHPLHLRVNKDRWPPLHTPIIWQRNISCRAGELMHTMPGGLTPPQPGVISLVTGQVSYNDFNIRETLHRWTYQPQLLWDGVLQTLQQGVEWMIHVGPEPNIIPATYKRLQENVAAQIRQSLGMRALSGMVNRAWLQALLPQRAFLLRAVQMQHLVLEDWLLAQPVA